MVWRTDPTLAVHQRVCPTEMAVRMGGVVLAIQESVQLGPHGSHTHPTLPAPLPPPRAAARPGGLRKGTERQISQQGSHAIPPLHVCRLRTARCAVEPVILRVSGLDNWLSMAVDI